MSEPSSAVLIAGRGLTGLTTALFFAWYGVPHVLVERQGDLPPGALPIALNPRTVELFRSTGLEAALRQAAVSPKAFSNLDCPWSGVSQKPAWLAIIGAQRLEPGQDSLSPCRGILSAHSAVADLLRARAEVLGSDLRFGTRLVAFEPEAEGIKAVLEHPITGTQGSLRAQYLVVTADSYDESRRRPSIQPGGFEPDTMTEDGLPPLSWQYQSGRAYFAGRAARTLTIPALFALNLDLQDAHNLAWKLAYVVKGLAGPALLDSYEAERRPLAPTASAAQHSGTRGANHGQLSSEPTLVRGVHPYHSTAVLTEDGDAPYDDQRMPNGRPGTRVPHVVLQRNDHSISTLDLCGSDFVLLAGAEGQAWCEAAERAADRLGIDLEAYCIGGAHEISTRDERWPVACGLTKSGALLIRPDGYVGWRARAALPDPKRVLMGVLARLLCRGSEQI